MCIEKKTLNKIFLSLKFSSCFLAVHTTLIFFHHEEREMGIACNTETWIYFLTIARIPYPNCCYLVKKAWNSPWVRSGGLDYEGVSYVSRLSSLSLLSTLQSFSLLVLITTITTCEFRPVPQLVSFTIELLRKVRLMASQLVYFTTSLL